MKALSAHLGELLLLLPPLVVQFLANAHRLDVRPPPIYLLEMAEQLAAEERPREDQGLVRLPKH